jgi:pilus assembly protein CpaB
MDPRTRRNLFILVGVVILVVAVVAVLLLGGGDDDPEPAQDVVQEQTQVPRETQGPTEEPETPVPTQELTQIVVAVQNISRGSEILPDAVRLQFWPVDAVPFGALTDPEDIIGRIARTDIIVQQPVLDALVVDRLDNLADVGSDAAAVLPPGRVAVSLPMDRITSVSYAIQPGDRVDIVVSMLFIDIDEEFQARLPNAVNLLSVVPEDNQLSLSVGTDVSGRFETRRIPVPIPDETLGIRTLPIDWPAIVRPIEAPRPRLLTHRTIQNAQVIWTGNFPASGRLDFAAFEAPTLTPIPATPDPNARATAPPAATPVPPRPDVVTLSVTPQEAVIITWLVEAGVPVTFLLRSAGDASGIPTDPVSLEYILDTYGIVPPEPSEIGIQPAIRSIRRIILDSTISLDN